MPVAIATIDLLKTTAYRKSLVFWTARAALNHKHAGKSSALPARLVSCGSKFQCECTCVPAADAARGCAGVRRIAAISPAKTAGSRQSGRRPGTHIARNEPD